jgi:hypothetical protein
MRLKAIAALLIGIAPGLMAPHAQAAGDASLRPDANPPAARAGAGHLKPDAALPRVLHAADTYRLWTGRAPGATNDSPEQTPTLTWFEPPLGSANGTAVVVAPGGRMWAWRAYWKGPSRPRGSRHAG